MWLKWLVTFALVLIPLTGAQAAKVDIGTIEVDSTPTEHEKDLAGRARLVVYGWTDSAQEEYPTGKQVVSGKLVNYVQTIHVKRALKGTSPRLVKLLTCGIDPLPDPRDPLNNRYPGPLGEGNYILFLKKVSGANLYTLVGIWQGVYPVVDGKSVALKGSGYPLFRQLTVDQFAKKLNSLLKRP
jgi:hypothetical protein